MKDRINHLTDYAALIGAGQYPQQFADMDIDQSHTHFVEWAKANPSAFIEAVTNTSDDNLFDAMQFECRKQLAASYSESEVMSREELAA